MTWELKTQMIQAANAENWEEFNKIALENAHEMDEQALEMYATCIDLSNTATYSESAKAVLDQRSTSGMLSFRADLRIEMLDELMK